MGINNIAQNYGYISKDTCERMTINKWAFNACFCTPQDLLDHAREHVAAHGGDGSKIGFEHISWEIDEYYDSKTQENVAHIVVNIKFPE